MSDFLTLMTTLFTFLFTQLGNVANWFVNNILGQIIIGVILFTSICYIFGYIIEKVRR